MPIAANPAILTLHQQAASLLLYQNVLADAVGQAFLELLRSLQAPTEPEQCVQAYGQWFHCLHQNVGFEGNSWKFATDNVFSNKHGTLWTSQHCCMMCLYPSLPEQCGNGDSLLHSHNNTPGNTIQDKFWSLHCHQWGSVHLGHPLSQ